MSTNWNDYRFFLSLSRTRSFVAAARQLQVTHSTVSRRIIDLEATLQTQLFIRTERGCALTTAGEKLLPYAEELERAALKLQEHIPTNESRLSGKIRIGTPDGLGNCFLASELTSLLIKNPLLEIELVSVPMYYSLSKREVDILITVKKPTAKNLIVEKITNYKLGLFASRSYLENNSPIQEANDLKTHRLVGYIDDLLYDQRLRFLEELFPASKTIFRSSTVLAQMNAIKAGAGIGVIPYFMAHQESSLVQILPPNYVTREFWVQVTPDSNQLPRVKATMRFIIDTIHSKRKLFLSMKTAR